MQGYLSAEKTSTEINLHEKCEYNRIKKEEELHFRITQLTETLLDTAIKIAREEPLTLAGIKMRVLELHPDASDFSIDRLSVGLKKRGFSFKRCRLSLKKSETKTISEQPKPVLKF